MLPELRFSGCSGVKMLLTHRAAQFLPGRPHCNTCFHTYILCQSCELMCGPSDPSALVQLATIKAKSEALRLRQEFELDKFRAKYRTAQAARGDSPPGHREAKDKAPEKLLDGSDSSEAELSIRTDEAFDEPLKVTTPKSLVCPGSLPSGKFVGLLPKNSPWYSAQCTPMHAN